MHGICSDEAPKNPSIVVDVFYDFARERHLAIAKTLHDRLVETGKLHIEQRDLGGLRRVISQIVQNRYPTRFTSREAWILCDSAWNRIHPAQVLVEGAVLSEAAFLRVFGPVRALPPCAFKRWWAPLI